MLGLGSNLIRSAYRRGLAYVRDGLKLYMPYRGANHSEVKFVGSGSSYFTTNDYVDTGATFQSTFRGSFTISAWIKPDDGQPAADICIIGAKNSAAEDQVGFFLRDDGKLSFVYESDNDVATTICNSVQYADGQGDWGHCVVTVDDTLNQVLIYFNGVSQTLNGSYDGDISAITNSDYTSVDELFIGALDNNGSAANFFAGNIKNVAIWSRVLTATEVQNVMYKTYDELSGRLTSNLVSWWSLESGQGDFHGSNAGTNQGSTVVTGIYDGNVPVIPRAIDNAPTVQADGIGIGSASFTASNDDYVDCGDAVSGISDYPFSVTGWFKGETKSGDGHLFTINDVSANNVKYGVLLRQSLNEGEVRIFAQNTTTQSNTYGSANQFNDDDWHHFAAVFENATSHKLYVDGVYGVANTTSVTFNSATDSFVIGIDKDSDGLGKEFQGEMAQVGLWSKAMTQAQILSVMEKTYDEFNADDKTSLVSYWALDENANDSHGSNNGTLS